MAKTYEAKDTTNRIHTISIRLSDDELARLRYICERLNVTQSEYVREAILTAKVTRPMLVTALDSESIRVLLAHFGKICSNLNQIALALNQSYQADTGILEALHNSLQSLNQGVKVLQTVGGQC